MQQRSCGEVLAEICTLVLGGFDIRHLKYGQTKIGSKSILPDAHILLDNQKKIYTVYIFLPLFDRISFQDYEWDNDYTSFLINSDFICYWATQQRSFVCRLLMSYQVSHLAAGQWLPAHYFVVVFI